MVVCLRRWELTVAVSSFSGNALLSGLALHSKSILYLLMLGLAGYSDELLGQEGGVLAVLLLVLSASLGVGLTVRL